MPLHAQALARDLSLRISDFGFRIYPRCRVAMRLAPCHASHFTLCTPAWGHYNQAMSVSVFAHFHGLVGGLMLAAGEPSAALPKLIANGGLMLWVLFVASTLAILVFVERFYFYHRAQINSMEFLNGVRTVLKRDNVVEALSICDATPGPVARLVKVAIVNRDKGRESIRDALEEAGLIEVPLLEEKLNLLSTIAHVSPLVGLLGTVLGLIKVFTAMQLAGSQAYLELLSGGIWQALISTAAGLAVAIPAYAGYNYLVYRVNAIVLDMEKAATEITNILLELSRAAAPASAPRP